MWEPLATGAPGGWTKALSLASEPGLLRIRAEWEARLEALDPRWAPRLDLLAARSTLSRVQGLLLSGRTKEARQELRRLCHISSIDMGAFDFYAAFGPARDLSQEASALEPAPVAPEPL